MDFSKLRAHLDDAERISRLESIQSRLTEHPFPPQLVVESTSICNLACIHCSHREMSRKGRTMKRALWNKIVEEVGRESPDCEVWPTFYGEALILRTELWDRLDYAAQAGCRNLVLNSNGTLLDRWGNLENVLRSPLRRFILSLDGLSRETFETIRAKAKWDQVYPAVEELCRKRKELGLTYPTITVQFSVMKENADEIESFRAYWHQRGAEVKVRPMLEWTATGSVRADAIRHDRDFRIACPWANNTMAIHQDGAVVACAVDFDARFSVGNAGEASIKDLWQRLGRQLRAHHRAHRWDQIPDLCKGCGDWQVAGASYEQETVEGTRPFWYRDNVRKKTEND